MMSSGFALTPATSVCWLIETICTPVLSTCDDPGVRRHRALLATFIAAAALTTSGCGSASDVSVIRDWANALRVGDLNRAASYFALPAVVQNGTPPIRITTREQVREFNRLLPCGAVLVRTARDGRYIDATFRLTNRVGGDCGPGAGGIAATAFVIRGGKIAEWRRLPDPQSGPQPTGPPPPGSSAD